MDPRRIKKTGAQGAAKANKQNQQRIDAIQSRASGDVQIPRVSFLRQEAQTIPDTTWTGVDYDFEEYDDNLLHVGTTDSEFVFGSESAGVWQINIYCNWESNTTGSRHIRVMLNDEQEIPQSYMREVATSATSAGASFLQSNFMITVSESDVLSVQVAQFSGDPLDLLGASFQAFRIGV